MLKFKDLVEGVEYWKEPNTIHEEATIHKIKNGLFLDFHDDDWKLSMLHVNDVLKSNYYECKWMFEYGKTYYYPYYDDNLYSQDCWKGDEYDLAIKRNVGIYRTAEEAIAKAKELGWT
jgi:hypothetical protein